MRTSIPHQTPSKKNATKGWGVSVFLWGRPEAARSCPKCGQHCGQKVLLGENIGVLVVQHQQGQIAPLPTQRGTSGVGGLHDDIPQMRYRSPEIVWQSVQDTNAGKHSRLSHRNGGCTLNIEWFPRQA